MTAVEGLDQDDDDMMALMESLDNQENNKSVQSKQNASHVAVIKPAKPTRIILDDDDEEENQVDLKPLYVKQEHTPLENLFKDEDVSVQSSPHRPRRLQPKPEPKVDMDSSSESEIGFIERAVRESKQEKPVEKKESRLKVKSSGVFEPLMPTSTPYDTGKRRYLYMSAKEYITTRNDTEPEDELPRYIVDVSRPGRSLKFTDHRGLSMASMASHGVLFAAPAQKANRSLVQYKPFEGSTDEWALELGPGEQVHCISLGESYAAIGCDQRVRLLSFTGVQLLEWTLAGRILAMTSRQSDFFIVYQDLDRLQYMWVDVDSLYGRHGRLPVNQMPIWVGYSSLGMPCVYDQDGHLRALMHGMSDLWCTLFDAREARQGRQESYWPVGVTDQQMQCIVLKGEEIYPSNSLRPTITSLDLRTPILPMANEDESLMRQRNLFVLMDNQFKFMQESRKEVNHPMMDTATRDHEYDRHLLQLIFSAARQNQAQRVLQMVQWIREMKTFDIVLKMLHSLQRSVLVERVESIQRERELAQLQNSFESETGVSHLQPMDPIEEEESQVVAPPSTNLVTTPGIDRAMSRLPIRSSIHLADRHSPEVMATEAPSLIRSTEPSGMVDYLSPSPKPGKRVQDVLGKNTSTVPLELGSPSLKRVKQNQNPFAK